MRLFPRVAIMPMMATLEKVNVSQVAATLNRPFSMATLARVGDIVVSVYICQGVLAWHRHLDHDELFWAYDGTIVLESEWGNLALRPREMAVVPKGVGHRSASQDRASVILLRCGVAPERKNGRRRLYATGTGQKLIRVSLHQAREEARRLFHFHTIASVEETAVQVGRGQGTWQVEIPARHDLLLMVVEGSGMLRTSESMVHLHAGDLATVRAGMIYHLSTAKDTVLARVVQPDPPL